MRLARKILYAFYRPWIEKKIHKTSVYKKNNITLTLPPGVFHPDYFHSTKFLCSHILSLPLKGRKLLELGAGNGYISICSAKSGALVTSTDISSKAIAALKENRKFNQSDLT